MDKLETLVMMKLGPPDDLMGKLGPYTTNSFQTYRPQILIEKF